MANPTEQAAIRIPLEEITSSNLAALGYDGPRQRAAVKFKNGKIFYYAGITPDVMQTWYLAPSRGKYYAENIRGKYPAQLMTGMCPRCGDGPGFGGDTCDDCGCDVYVVPAREEVTYETRTE